MKQNRKSALIEGGILAALAFGLAGCDALNSIAWPHVYGPNEVPQSVVEAPRAVETAPPLPPDTTYPRLGDVPSHPKNFTPEATTDKIKQQMEDDRAQAGEIKQKVQSETPAQDSPQPQAQ